MEAERNLRQWTRALWTSEVKAETKGEARLGTWGEGMPLFTGNSEENREGLSSAQIHLLSPKFLSLFLSFGFI